MRWLIRAVFLLALIIGGFVLAERMVLYAFDPRRVPPDVAGVSEKSVESATGKKMYVWMAPAARGKPTILYLHGNAGGLHNRKRRFHALTKRGYGLVAPGYRGSSGSAGWPTEKLIMQDIRALYGDLVRGDLTGTPTRPIVYGESIGAAVAINLNASAIASEDKGVGGPLAMALEAPFTSLRDVARAMHPELVLATGFMTSHWRSIDHAALIRTPLLILHGGHDGLVPIEQGRAIFDAARSEDKAFFEVTDAGHIDVWKVAAQKRLYRFLQRF